MIDGKRLGGVVPPMVTPLHSDGKTVSEKGVHQLIDRLVGQGVNGIFAGGTTGEVYGLDDNQWDLLVRFAVEACHGQVPLYVGISGPSTSAAISRANRAEKMGADVLVSLVPYYISTSQAEIIHHYKALAKATDLAVIIYNYPGITKVSINLDTYVKLAKIPNIVGVKDSLGDVTMFRHMIDVLRSDGQDFRLFLGTDSLTDVVVLIGGQGIVPSIGNIAAEGLVKAFEAAVTGDWELSKAEQAKVNQLISLYDIAGKESVFRGIFAGLKCALQLLGIEAGPTVPPMLPCNIGEKRAIESLLRRYGLFT